MNTALTRAQSLLVSTVEASCFDGAGYPIMDADQSKAAVKKIRALIAEWKADSDTDVNRCADELEAALAQQAQPRCVHGEVKEHDYLPAENPETYWQPGPQRCHGPQQAQPEYRCGHGHVNGCVCARCEKDHCEVVPMPKQSQPEIPTDVREALLWIRDQGAGDSVGVYDRARFLARRLLDNQ